MLKAFYYNKFRGIISNAKYIPSISQNATVTKDDIQYEW
jgi:hypothetical protein